MIHVQYLQALRCAWHFTTELVRRRKLKKQRRPKKAQPSWSDVATPGAAFTASAIQQLPLTLLPAASTQQTASYLQQPAAAAAPANPESTLTAATGSSATPATVSELVGLVNVQLKPDHQITHTQVSALQDALGDVETLLELSIMQAGALNEVLRSDGKLHGMQIVAVRRTLKQLGS